MASSTLRTSGSRPWRRGVTRRGGSCPARRRRRAVRPTWPGAAERAAVPAGDRSQLLRRRGRRRPAGTTCPPMGGRSVRCGASRMPAEAARRARRVPMPGRGGRHRAACDHRRRMFATRAERARVPDGRVGCGPPSCRIRPACRARHRRQDRAAWRGDRPRPRAGSQVIRYPAEPRQCAELECSSESILDSHVRAEPAEVVVGQREERDQVIVGDTVRPATQPRELGIGQDRTGMRHAIRVDQRRTRPGGSHAR